VGFDELFTDFPGVSLDDVDRRASLQDRTDQKYLLPADALLSIAAAARDDHEVLEIDGARSFAYRSVYFDTPELTAFHDHVADRTPRWKIRTRHYVDTGTCHFEVKLKDGEGRTAKERLDHDPADADVPTDDGRELVARVLREAGLEPPHELTATLVTEFRRSTLVASGAAERTTVDWDVRLAVPDGPATSMHTGCALVETKTRDGNGALDRLIAEAGHEPVSLSKYRLGIGLLVARDVDRDYSRRLEGAFETSVAH
jgi:hypothetical protein